MMDVLNLAHGAFFLIGSYLAVTFAAGDSWGGFLTALGVAALVGLLAGGVLSGMTEPLARRPILDQALLTLGISLIVAETLSIIYGNDVLSVPEPPGLDGSVVGRRQPLPDLPADAHRASAWCSPWSSGWWSRGRRSARWCGPASPTGRWSRRWASTTGRSRSPSSGVGSLLATVAGVLAAPVYGARPGLDKTILLLALVVIVIGGLGSIRGALVGALVIGQVESLGRALVPELASFILFGTLALVLVVRPRGLFAGKVAH